MPAKPNNPNPFDGLAGLQGLVEQMKSGGRGWWDQVDRGLLEWPGHEVSAGSTGLFFLAAQNNKTVYTFGFAEMPLKLPKDCVNPVDESQRLVKEMIKEVEAIKDFNCIQQRKYLSQEDESTLLFKLYSGIETICMFSVVKSTDNARHISIDVRSMNEKLVDRLREISHKYITKHTANPQLFTVSEDEEGKMILASIGKPGIDLERGNYSDEVLTGFDYVVNQLNSKKPFGRLVIMYGPPGTGKTHLLRGLFNSLSLEKSKFIFLQPEFLFRHSVSALTRLLLEAAGDGDSLILLIEDADDCLVPRQADNMVAVSTLLNLADGFIGNMLDIRVIATTNASRLSIDSALKRPGRLCRIVEVGAISAEQANEIVKRETGKNGAFDKPVALADAYAAVAVEQGRIVDMGKIPTAGSGVGFAR